MCRFVAYFGEQSTLLADLLEKPTNSLIKQSLQAREGKRGLNADGCGVAWYGQRSVKLPAVLKSVQPAWNDVNLQSIARAVSSSCFLGHVRASTVGGVNFYNCHPFSFEQFSFVHNGTIQGFDHFRRDIANMLSESIFLNVHGQTDSEHLFALILELHLNRSFKLDEAVLEAMTIMIRLQRKHDKKLTSRLNIAISDGRSLFATRCVMPGNRKPMSLFYSAGAALDDSDDENIMLARKRTAAVVIASEPLSDYQPEWHEFPLNSYIYLTRKNYVPSPQPIKFSL